MSLTNWDSFTSQKNGAAMQDQSARRTLIHFTNEQLDLFARISRLYADSASEHADLTSGLLNACRDRDFEEFASINLRLKPIAAACNRYRAALEVIRAQFSSAPLTSAPPTIWDTSAPCPAIP